MPQTIGFIIFGMGHPDGTDGNSLYMYSHGNLQSVASLLPTVGAIIPYMPSVGAVSGFTWNTDPRKPFGDAAPITVSVVDREGALSRQFFRDVTQDSINQWELEETVVSAAQTVFMVYGSDAITVDSPVWLEDEALFVVATVPGTGYIEITVERGALGSVARAHYLRSRAWPTDRGGLSASLRITNKPQPELYKFPTYLAAFDMEGGEATSVIWSRFGYLSGAPRPKGTHYDFIVEDLTKLLSGHQFGSNRPSTPLSHCVSVNRVESTIIGNIPPVVQQATSGAQGGYSSSGNSGQTLSPTLINLYLTADEAESFMGPAFHINDGTAIDETLANFWIDLAEPGISNGSATFRYCVELELADWSGLFFIQTIEFERAGYAGSGQVNTSTPFIKVVGALSEHFSGSLKNVSIGAQPTAFASGKPEGFPQGISFVDRDVVLPTETPPKIGLRVNIYDTFVNTFLMLATSGIGDGANGVYDQISFGIGANLSTSYFNLGAAVDPSSADPATNLLLELGSLIDKKIPYPIRTTGDWSNFGKWINNECLANFLLTTCDPTSGKMSFVNSNRAVLSSPPDEFIREIEGDMIEPGGRLPKLDLVMITTGFMGMSLQPRDSRILRPTENDTLDRQTSTLEIRLWEIAQISSTVVFSLVEISTFYLKQLGGGPPVWKVPSSMLSHIYTVGAFTRFIHPMLQGPDGIGVDIVCMVVGTDHDLATGKHAVVLKPYGATLSMQSLDGLVGPSWLLTAARELSSSNYRLTIRPIGYNTATDVRYDFEGIFDSIKSDGSRIRIFSQSFNNPNFERAGWLRCYAEVVQSVSFNEIDVAINAGYERDGHTYSDLLVPFHTIITTADVSKANSNPEGIPIFPASVNRYPSEFAIVVYAPRSPMLPLDAIYYTYK